MSKGHNYAQKAQRALQERGLVDADSWPLASWAEDWYAACVADHLHPVSGVLIAEDGHVVGETRLSDGTWRLTPETQKKFGQLATVLDMTLGKIAREVGQRVVPIRAHDVAPGRPVKPEDLKALSAAALQREDLLAQADAADAKLTKLIRSAHDAGHGVAPISRAVGFSRQTIYDRLKE